MTNQPGHMQPSPPPAVERAAAGGSHSPTEDNQLASPPLDSSPIQRRGTAHSHLHSHLRRRFAHTHPHSPSSSLSTSVTDDHELKLSNDSQTGQGESSDDTHLDNSHENNQHNQLREADADTPQPDSEDSLVDREVQTVSLVRLVDGLGNTIDTQIIYPSSVVDAVPDNTGDISAPGSSGTAAPGTNPGASDNVPPPPYPTTPRSTAPGSPSSAATPVETTPQPTGTPISSVVSGSGTATASNSSFTSMAKNSTMTSTTLSSTTSSTSESTTSSETTILSSTSSTSPSSILSTSSSVSDLLSVASTDASPTGGYEVGGGSGTNGDSGQPSTTDAAGDSEGNGGGGGGGVVLSHQQKQIVGGVVGGVAGAAFLLVLLLMALKWKNRRSDVQELIGERGVATRSLASGGGGPGNSGGMSERALPFGAAGALAGLAGRKSQASSADAAVTGERGFYRVSGRKLPSVLQHGGDGYSDPRPAVPPAGGASPDQRNSAGSGCTEWYRGSQAFEPATGTPLSLGSPMRPVSGVVIMREGPGKTPVTEQNPFADPPSPSSFPLPPEGLGVGYGPQHDPRGGPSKFQEYVG